MSDNPAAAEILAHASARTRFSLSTTDVRLRVLDIFADTLAVMALGSDRGPHRRLQAMLSAGAGKATVIGRRSPVAASVATVLNGTTPTVYQIDEGHRQSRGHPGIHVVPAAFALAEERDASKDDLFSAILAGYEVAARLGQSLGGTKPDIHPHGNWGTIGAAVAAAHLLSAGNEQVISTAIDMAAAVTLSPDRSATTAGSGVHHLFPSLGAHIGLVSGAAAAAGMTSTPGCLENFMAPRSGTSFDREVLLSGIDQATGAWSRHMVLENYFKFWPACAHTHTTINALLSVRDQAAFTADEIESIEVRAFLAAASLTETDVDNDLAARYSIPYVAAATIIDQQYGLDSLRPGVLTAPQTAALARRVHVTHDGSLDTGYPVHGRPVELTVHLIDGREFTARKSVSFGDVEVPPAREAVWSKAEELLTHRFDAVAAKAILAAARALESDGEITLLSAALRSAGQDGEEADT